MNSYELTPRTNNTINKMVFTGAFGQPDGFGSVLEVEIKQDGRLVLICTYRLHGSEHDHVWTIELDNEQRVALGEFIPTYSPRLYHYVRENEKI